MDPIQLTTRCGEAKKLCKDLLLSGCHFSTSKDAHCWCQILWNLRRAFTFSCHEEQKVMRRREAHDERDSGRKWWEPSSLLLLNIKFSILLWIHSKTLLRLAMARIKLLRNKRDLQIKQLRKEIAQLLTAGQEPSARIRVRSLSLPNLQWDTQWYPPHSHIVLELFWRSSVFMDICGFVASTEFSENAKSLHIMAGLILWDGRWSTFSGRKTSWQHMMYLSFSVNLSLFAFLSLNLRSMWWSSFLCSAIARFRIQIRSAWQSASTQVTDHCLQWYICGGSAE